MLLSGQLRNLGLMDNEGKPSYADDMRSQLNLVLDNLEIVLQQSGLKLKRQQ